MMEVGIRRNREVVPTRNRSDDAKSLSSDRKGNEDKVTNKTLLSDPDVFAKYLQLLFNCMVVLSLFFMVGWFFYTIKLDVDFKVEQEKIRRRLRIQTCKDNYINNECAPELRVPALESLCDEWLTCINEETIDLNTINTSTILWAKTLAEVLNSFVESISFRTFLFILLSVTVTVVVTNVTFGSYRVYHYQNND
ncbi:hypothetical protein Kpol_380p9 [Vanderwaltozyma polyspora DSM 70294]|uniref:Brl1/Brr6 domain-containing protein n=1 Tax=Vanderwaltozyma polyspora (strain ATCC 22028 / DSM 70294 / BCRC 21397 / CBS 2163 / NBRC 10782 / NRRL Y-8283 / UCD 57-17) TaxID=436907 RepID=A7TS68_VANPO|nr:uncharacterized protein Kpol_380p9 [Vanderwaltozyma polyspora DSM 70294]EDO14890.1 hypothetical protein Kpol_380p9 [Vanderwaltozyma polyspora DSM 70294]